MNKTKIEWCDYTSNPVKGYCPNACPYCYARAMYDRFGWDKTIRLVREEFIDWSKAKPREKVFVGSTIDLFGEWIPDVWMNDILGNIQRHPSVIFQFLTKFPQNLPKWSPFPENCWVGMSYTGVGKKEIGFGFHFEKIEAKVKFISFEPLLARHPDAANWHKSFNRAGINWLIIGAQTNPYRPPKLEWVQEIIEAADRASLPVFLKENLRGMKAISSPLLRGLNLRQEFPDKEGNR